MSKPPDGGIAGRGLTAADGSTANRGSTRAGRHHAAGTAMLDEASLAGQFTQVAREFAAARRGQPLALLQAGWATAADGIDVALLRRTGCEVSIGLVDTGDDVVRAALESGLAPVSCTLGDLRTVALPPRSYDIAVCSLLLQRISHAELVLDRIVEALRPGGLLLLRTADRDCAAGFIDRVLPEWARKLAWRKQRPGEPGPYPAVYEDLVSARGIQAYVQRRGLVIARREAPSGPATGRRPPHPLTARALVARLSRGRLTSGHDELAYVIRKPLDLFARVL